MSKWLRGIPVLLFVAGCSGSAYPPPPETRVETVVDVIHGVEIADDYRWLEEQDAPETRAWIAAQNAYAETVVGESPLRDHIRTRLRELMDTPDVGRTRKEGDYEYFSMRRPGEEAPVIYRRPIQGDEGGESEEPSVDVEYEVVLDPSAFDPGYRILLDMVDFSPDGRLMMYSVREGGADEIEIRVRDVTTGEDLPDRLPRALYGGVSFDRSGEGYTYTHRSRTDGPRIRHHRLGTPSESDELVWGEGYGPTAFAGMDEVEGGRYRIFSAQHGWARADVFIQDTRDGEIRVMAEGVPAHFQTRYHDGRIYVLTDHGAPKYRLMVADPARPAIEAWEELIPEGEDVLQAFAFIEGRIYATYLHDVGDRIRVFEMDGTPAGDVEVPAYTTAGIRASSDGSAALSLRSHLEPGEEWEVDLATGARTLSDTSDVPFDASGFVVRQIEYTSADGTRAPLYVMHREGITLDGSHPTILNGYGGFNVSIKPGFSTTAAVWMEMGGVYAVATLRGGSEFGEEWHRGGMLVNKKRVFEDFIGAAEALVERGYTSPEHLGISGGSNGGLLVASSMALRPDLFRAVLCTYPDLDMLRFNTFTATNNMPALLEYGDAANPEHFRAMLEYSPYQAVRDGVDYPAVMLATGDLDTRVPPLQARRMTARLQAASGSGLPVILWYDEMGGHAAGRGRSLTLRVEDTARELTFMAQQLGLNPGEGNLE
ncbi:MAG: prolyl oligopeptidase family serine peptidase [Gemmatimonadota bacterium]|nr:prolyl oligopeptidase family serine peptidase [Gemmatimonadota bacterium]